jgi:hypothetical protein
VIDTLARAQAASASAQAEAAHEAIGQVLGEVRAGLLRIESMLVAHMREGHGGNGSAIEEIDLEITANGTHVSMTAYRQLQMRLDRIEGREKAADEARQRLALEAQGAAKLVTKWRKRFRLALAIGGPVGAVIGWLLHHFGH